MPRFTPRSGGGSGDREPDVLLPPGNYLLAMVWFRRQRSQNTGTEYLSLRYEVLGGKFAGKGFFGMLSLDLERESTGVAWGLYCGAIDWKEEFELGSFDERTDRQGDADIRRIFLRVPFAATVDVERGEGNYSDKNRIHRYLFPRDWPEGFAQWAAEYERKQASRGQSKPEDSARQGRLPVEESLADPDAFNDDDIPF